MFFIAKSAIKLFLAIVFANWLVLEADSRLPGSRDAALGFIQSIEVPSTEEIFEDGMPSFSAIGSKIDDLVTDVDFNGIKSFFSEDKEEDNIKAQMKFSQVKLKELSIDPDLVFNNQEFFDALENGPVEWETF